MRPSELARVACRCVPGSGKPDIRPLRSGLVNDTFRVRRDGAFYALRVPSARAVDLGQDRAWEARVLELAAAQDLAPALKYSDPDRGILVLDWIDGQPWTPAEVMLPPNIARMAQLLRRLHAMPLPAPARTMTPAKWIEYYVAAAGERTGRMVRICAAASSPALRTAAAARVGDLAALPATAAVLCHSDLHILNVMDRAGSLVLLDWEYAHAADPLWDLAGWSANNDFDAEQQWRLLEAYGQRPPTREDVSRLGLLGWLYDYVCLLWGELYLNLRSRARGRETHGGAENGIGVRARLLAARLEASL